MEGEVVGLLEGAVAVVMAVGEWKLWLSHPDKLWQWWSVRAVQVPLPQVMGGMVVGVPEGA